MKNEKDDEGRQKMEEKKMKTTNYRHPCWRGRRKYKTSAQFKGRPSHGMEDFKPLDDLPWVYGYLMVGEYLKGGRCDPKYWYQIVSSYAETCHGIVRGDCTVFEDSVGMRSPLSCDGVDVYEGDIVEAGATGTQAVVCFGKYGEHHGWYIHELESDKVWAVRVCLGADWEIIGNTFERRN